MKCGTENKDDVTVCVKCNHELKNVKKLSRTPELIMGIIGGIFGLIGGLIALLVSSFAPDIAILGISAILASIAGIIGTVFITKNPKWGGVILIISAIWLLISISLFGIIGSVMFGIAGLSGIFRK
jgi:hypothetical protein